MLKVYNYDIVFQEIPDEVTLAVNLTGCPVHCPGCHSPHLWQDIGEVLDEALLKRIHREYAGEVTCICLMGGDGDPAAAERLCAYIKEEMGLRSGWWSGRAALPAGIRLAAFDYIKTGPYIEALGGLKSRTTNQRLFRVTGEKLEDITARFWR
ncbi:MAG: anaerobic ribonucleoside-triphosphate reductase activating protein [Bacteroidales bacterium]|nr:anaerobic ribonucleoside-triphosphate reductase activating protein [Bacteroidales bacterium]